MEAVQDRLGRKLLGASRTVAGEAIRGEMGWRKLEERREEKKKLYGRRFWELYIGEERLVKLIVEKLKESGGVGWREEYEMLLRKYGLEVYSMTGGSRRGRVRVSSSLEEENRKTELGRLARRGGQEK